MPLIKIETNIDEVVKNLGSKSNRIVRAIKTAIRKSGFLVERRAKLLVTNRMVNVITGRLRNSINTTLGKSGIGSFSATIQPNVDYAIFLHEGTRYIRARPFMTTARRDVQGEIEDTFQREIHKAIK